jgi:hypothetical protein
MHGVAYDIAWFVVLLVSINLIYSTIGIHYMVSFFPEGKRWYQLPLQLVTLALFATVVLYHPF